MNEQDLLKLKKQIDTAKSERDKLKGQYEFLMQELATKWKCKSLKEAEALSAKMTKELKELDKQITVGLQRIEQEFQND